jgi:hypothetical protein
VDRFEKLGETGLGLEGPDFHDAIHTNQFIKLDR